MGSKLRKLRVQAGITGLAHQKREREAYRLRERARRAERAKLELGDGFALVGVNSPGGQMRNSEELPAKLKPLAAERSPNVTTTYRGDGPISYEAVPVEREPGAPAFGAPKRRMPPMATLLALSMMAGLALPPREDK
jgi:hypothetical protein